MWQFCETVSSGSVLIRDRAGKEHSFVGNFTNVEIDVVKDDVVVVEGRVAFFPQEKGLFGYNRFVFWFNFREGENIISYWKYHMFMEGDCCFELFSEPDGYGEKLNQLGTGKKIGEPSF